MPYKDPEKQKAAQARYFQENKAALLKAQNVKRNLWRRHIQEVKESTPCMDCGLRYPHYVMDFDHRPGTKKRFNIGTSVARFSTLDDLKSEIAKCDGVCSNCHRHRTFMRKVKI